MSKKLTLGKDKRISGVCSGIAEYFELDVSLVRLIVLALIIFTALVPGTLFYIIASLIIPKEGS